MDKHEVKVIEDQEVASLLKRIGVYRQFADGEIHCERCEATVFLQDIGAIRRRQGSYRFFCTDCIKPDESKH